MHAAVKGLHGLTLEPYYLPMLVASRDSAFLKRTWVPLFLPHELANAAWEAGSAQFTRTMGTPESVAQFWAESLQEEWAQQHPLAADRDGLQHVIPLFFHSDGAGVKNYVEYHIWGMSSAVSGCGDSWQSRLLLAGVPIEFMQGRHIRRVHREIVGCILWSLSWAERGLHPNEGFRGEPFKKGSRRWAMRGLPVAGPWRFAWAGWKGDLEARKVPHLMAHGYKCTCMCDWCFAQNGYKL
eukprot:9083586-Alexandrium_andersonii.AAC.1